MQAAVAGGKRAKLDQLLRSNAGLQRRVAELEASMTLAVRRMYSASMDAPVSCFLPSPRQRFVRLEAFRQIEADTFTFCLAPPGMKCWRLIQLDEVHVDSALLTMP